VTQAVLCAALAISGTFERLALLGNTAALLSYASCCAAAWQLRRKDVRATEARYDVPGAAFAPPVALLSIAWLLSGVSWTEWLASALVAAVAAVVAALKLTLPRQAPETFARFFLTGAGIWACCAAIRKSI